MRLAILVGSFALGALALGVLAEDDTDTISVKRPYGHHLDRAASKKNRNILYHGGPVLVGATPVYAVYYGAFARSTAAINNLIYYLNGSSQYNVNTTYYEVQNGSRIYILNALTFPASSSGSTISYSNVYVDASYSLGTTLGRNGPIKILQKALAGGHLPIASDAVYFVFTSADVKITGTCSSYCAYHANSTAIIGGVNIRYAFVPDLGTTCNLCDGNYTNWGEEKTPNGDIGIDEMTDSLMHELSETVTDPDGTAWWTANGSENGDLCNYNYGTTKTMTVSGSTVHYNATFGGFNYLIQTIWENTGAGFCANTLP